MLEANWAEIATDKQEAFGRGTTARRNARYKKWEKEYYANPENKDKKKKRFGKGGIYERVQSREHEALRELDDVKLANFRGELRDTMDSYVEDVHTFVRAISHSWGFKADITSSQIEAIVSTANCRRFVNLF